MRILGLIPARAGSRRLPGKNLALLGGRPLIAYTCEAARASGVLDGLYVNTDSPAIAAAAAEYGVACPVLRPAALADAETPTHAANAFFLNWLAERGERFDGLVVLQPTSPLRTAADIRAGVDLFRARPDRGVIGVTPVAPRHWLGTMAADGAFERCSAGAPMYRINGALYVYRPEDHARDRTIPVQAYVMPAERSVDIDTPADLAWAEWLLRTTEVAGVPG